MNQTHEEQPVAVDPLPYLNPDFTTKRERIPKRRKPMLRDKVMNQCPDRDVMKPQKLGRAVVPLSAGDLTDQQIYFLLDMAEQFHASGLKPEDYTYMLGFKASETCGAIIANRRRQHPEWEQHLELARIGWDAWYTKRYGHPPGPRVDFPAEAPKHYTR